MLVGERSLVALASLLLLGSLIVGKVGVDLRGFSAPDTAVLMIQFVAVIFFMEASRVVLSFDRETRILGKRTDDGSEAARARLFSWVGAQLWKQVQIIVATLVLSLVLLVFGGLTSVSLDQVGSSGVLVLVVVGVLVFLITQRREPETRARLG